MSKFRVGLASRVGLFTCPFRHLPAVWPCAGCSASLPLIFFSDNEGSMVGNEGTERQTWLSMEPGTQQALKGATPRTLPELLNV